MTVDSDNNEDDLLADVLPNRKDCNMDIVYKELDKDPKFRNVSKWLKGIQGTSGSDYCTWICFL